MKRLFLLDPNLSDFTGHYANHALAFSEYCEQHRITFHCLGAKVPGKKKFLSQVEPVFTRTSVSMFRNQDNPFASYRDYAGQFCQNLQSYFKKYPLKSGDGLLIQNAHLGHLRGFLEYFWRFHTQIPVSLYVQFFYFPNMPPYHMNIPSAALQALGLETMESFRSLGHVRLCLATEDPQQSVAYSSFLGCATGVLPVPVNWKLPLARKRRREPIKIYLPGAARLEKGFDWLPSVFESFHEYLKDEKIAFYFQTHFHEGASHPYLETVRDALKERKGVYPIAQALTREAYQQQLNESDIVILPYRKDRYTGRGSGVVIEALCAGKPVVVPAHTFLSEKAAGYGHARSYEGDSCENFIRALKDLVDDVLKGKVLKPSKYKACIRDHSTKMFFRSLQRLKPVGKLSLSKAFAWQETHSQMTIEASLKILLPWLFSRLNQAGKRRVYILGAGSHTQHLLPLWKNLGGPPILGIIDTEHDRRINHEFHLPVISYANAKKLNFNPGTALVLSSSLYEEPLSLRALTLVKGKQVFSIWKPLKDGT